MNKKIAIPVDDENFLDGHFGHSKYFAIFYTCEDKIEKVDRIIPPPHEPGLLPRFLFEQGVTDVISGGLGNKAISLLKAENINVIVGVECLEAQELVKKYLNGTLVVTTNSCSH